MRRNPINVVVSRLVGVDLPFVVALAGFSLAGGDDPLSLVMGDLEIVGQGYTEPNAIVDFIDQVNRKRPDFKLLVSDIRIVDRVTVGLRGIENA